MGRWAGGVASAALLVGLLPQFAAAQPRHAVDPVAEPHVSSAVSASERAAESGDPVEVVADRTSYSSTVANPDGTFTLTQSTTPQRVQASDGSWGPVDATLVHRADGSVGPKAAVVGLSFSGGGSGKGMIRLSGRKGSMSLEWPGVLPDPVLEGATATYPDVLDGVDLQLTATAEGYQQVLVVKTAQAAANPALEQIRMPVTGDGLTVSPGAGGGLRAVDLDGNTVFSGPAGQMWDSAGDDAPSAGALARRTAGADDPGPGDQGQGDTGPGDGDASSMLPVGVQEDTVTVEPDLGLLRGSGTVYPVFIDPPVGLGASERTVLSSDGDRFWQFKGEYGIGKCGNADGYLCGSGYVNRMFFEFAPTKLSGKQVLDATFRAHETWSFNCDAHWVNLERTNNISEGTKWPGPSQLDLMGDRNVSAGRGDNCSPGQPDQWIEFNDNPAETNENLTSTVKSFADGKISRFTLMLGAKDESDTRSWKRFDDNAELQVTYVPKPGVPTGVGVIPGTGTTSYCRTSATDPLTVTRADPLLNSVVQTAVQPKTGEEKGSLQAEYVVERQLRDETWASTWTAYRPTSGWVEDGKLQQARISPQASGQLYRYHSRTQSHWSYSGKTGDLFSGYSSWCYFKIDADRPQAPQITSGTPYTECVADLCEGHGGPGVKGSFTFAPNAADKDVTGYRWRLLTTSEKGAKTVAGQTVTVPDITPSLAGTQILSVEATDSGGYGEPAEFEFKVAAADGAVGHWNFAELVPGAGQMTAADTATFGTRHTATLVGAEGTGGSTRARRGEADNSLRLNDDTADPALQVGHAETAAPVVNTHDSFTVSTWVQLSDPTQNRNVLAQTGTQGAAFILYYSSSLQKWVFARTDTDKEGSTLVRSTATTPSPQLNVWTHLAGVFDSNGDADPSNDTIQLFVNGRPQGQPVNLSHSAPSYTPWTATEGLQIGRSKSSGTYNGYFFGLMDEVNAWQRALTPDEVAQDAELLEDNEPANELVAEWDATVAKGTTIGENSIYPLPEMQLSAKGATIDENDNALVLDGTSGYAATTGPAVDDSGSFTVSARARLDTAAFAGKPVGYQAQVAAQRAGTESSWALWAVKVADDTFQWKFTRTAVDAAGTVTQSATLPADDVAEADTWVQVTGVFDAQEAWEWTDPADPTKTETRYGKVHLYVGQSEQRGSLDNSGFTAGQQGDGELGLGRGTANGTTGNYLPGGLEDLRIWTGAMNQDQISSRVLDSDALTP